MAELNIVIDTIEEVEDDKGKRYLKITDKAGVTRNFKEGRNNLLANKEHLLEPEKAIKIFLRDYTNPEGKTFPYVYDFETISDIFEQQATEKVQTQVFRDKENSIESQVAFKGFIELACADKLKMNDPIILATLAWGIQKMGGNLETTKTQAHTPPNSTTPLEDRQRPPSQVADKGEKLVTNAQELMKWASSKGKEYVPSKVRELAGIEPNVPITEEMAIEAYRKICLAQGWA